MRRWDRQKVRRYYVPIYGHKNLIWALYGGMFDTQFLHFCLEGGSFQTENLCGTARSGKAPTGLLQHSHQVHSLYILEIARGIASEDACLGR